MGCCVSFTKKVNVKIALKAPNGKTYMSIDKKEMIKGENIDEWIKTVLCDKKKNNYVVYNDQNKKVFSQGGHCKGILLWNNENITWLVHSVPHFPEQFTGDSISSINESQLQYGQSFACVRNIPIEHLQDILSSLSLMKAHVYMSTMKLPTQTVENTKEIVFTEKMKHVGKTPKLEESIYEIIQKSVKGKFIMETWNHGHKSKDNDHLKLNTKVKWPCGISYTTTQDHSKWAVSENTVCIGDLNYMESQLHRGGGALVIRSLKLAKQFQKLIEKK
jgi:hypothetical protein